MEAEDVEEDTAQDSSSDAVDEPDKQNVTVESRLDAALADMGFEDEVDGGTTDGGGGKRTDGQSPAEWAAPLDIDSLPIPRKRTAPASDAGHADAFDAAEAALTYDPVSCAVPSLRDVNPSLMVMKMDPPRPLNTVEPDPVLFAEAFRTFVAELTQYVYFLKSVVELASSASMQAAESAAVVACCAILRRDPATERWALPAPSVPSLLTGIFDREIFPRVGPQCAARILAFKEDRSMPLHQVHSQFLRLARMARDVTVRTAREKLINGLADDDAKSWLKMWVVGQQVARNHVSLQDVTVRHAKFAQEMDPQRLLPAVASVARIAPAGVGPRLCFSCGSPDHIRRNCPFRDEAPQTGPENYAYGPRPSLRATGGWKGRGNGQRGGGKGQVARPSQPLRAASRDGGRGSHRDGKSLVGGAQTDAPRSPTGGVAGDQ